MRTSSSTRAALVTRTSLALVVTGATTSMLVSLELNREKELDIYGFEGFGPRPSTRTPDRLVDAIVWVKPGGQADGTSDETAERYDEACGSETSLIPAPEAGSWFPVCTVQFHKNALKV